MTKKRSILKGWLVTVLVLTLLTGIMSAGAESTKYDAEVPSWAVKESRRYSYDFNETDLNYYKNDGGFTLLSSTGFVPKDGVLTCGFRKSFGIVSAGYLGDDYGIGGGTLSFKLSMKGGKFTLIMRDVSENPTRRDSYLNFEINSDGSVNAGDAMAKNIIKGAVKNIFASNSAPVITIEDHVTHIDFLVDGTLALKIDYIEKDLSSGEFSVPNYEAELVFTDKDGGLVGRIEGSKIQRAGRFIISVDDLDGYIDDLSFDRVDIDQSLPDSEPRVIDYSNWVATDDLGRTTPLNDKTGDPKEDKCVGIFYFIHCVGAGINIQDNTRLFLDLGLNGMKKYLAEKGGEAFWAEPYFGYYRNTDTWIYRKHAYMLEAAGVDFIFLDITNGVIFENAQLALFDTWLKIRREGGSTPQICFICGDTPELVEKDLTQMRKSGVFRPEYLEKYEELFFKWNGKPLIFANTENLSKANREFLENYEVRGCWAWQNKDGYWNWIEELHKDSKGNLSMYKGRDKDGVFEQLAITLGHHASTSKGRSFVLDVQNTNGLQNFEFYLDTTPQGTGFASQAEYALEQSPRCVMITGWNEWIAGNSRGLYFFANTPVNNVNYVDEFNPEFSRDGEPMRIRDGVGFGDNYYYQIIDFIRRYKGMDTLKTGENQENFDGNGAMDASSSAFDSAWANVGPEYRDTIGDVEFRNTMSYDPSFRYLNGTGRNDLESAKVCQDGEYLYFTVKTVHGIEEASDGTWMNLYIDSDMNHSTGWEGYDLVINRSRTGNTAKIEKLTAGSFEGTDAGNAEIAWSGNRLTVKIAKSIIGITEKTGINLDFKWADNSTETGNVLSFMDLGDTAPNDRFNFRFVGDSVKYVEQVKETEKANEKANSGCFGSLTGAAVLGLTALACLILVKRKER